MAQPSKVPCTVLIGYLGSGKTTLLNQILESQQDKRIAVIENEIGEVGINDINSIVLRGNYVFQVEEEILEASCGCMCKTVRGDLIRCLKRLKKRSFGEGKPLDRIIIETTGLADPAALVQTFFADEFVAEMCSLDGILTFVDAQWLMQQHCENRDYSVENEVAKQVAYADTIFLTKTDLVDEEALAQMKTRIHAINPSVPIRHSLHSQTDLKCILGIDAWSLDKVMDADEGFLDDDTKHHVITCQENDGLIKCFNMAGKEVFSGQVPPEEAAFGPWLWRAAQENIRKKGRLHLVQTDGQDIWLEPLQPFVRSVGIDVQGEVDKEKFDHWIGELLRGKEENLFRYKGIMAMKGHNAPFVFQGMQTRFTGAEHKHRAWSPDDQRRCRMHIMGKNLIRDEIVAGFMKCMTVVESETRSPMPAASSDTCTNGSCSCQ